MPWFPYILTIAVMLFAISPVLIWCYCCMKAWTHLFGRSKGSELTFKVFCTVFAVVSSLLTLQTLIDMADAVLFMLAVINIIGLYLLAPAVKRELNSFLAFVRRRDSRPRHRGRHQPGAGEDHRLTVPHGPAPEGSCAHPAPWWAQDPSPCIRS